MNLMSFYEDIPCEYSGHTLLLAILDTSFQGTSCQSPYWCVSYMPDSEEDYPCSHSCILYIPHNSQFSFLHYSLLFFLYPDSGC